MTSTHFDDSDIETECVIVEESTGESSPQDLCDPSSICTTEIDDDFIEVVLATADMSTERQEEQSVSHTAPLHGNRGISQAVSARYSLTTVIRIPSKGCKMCEASSGSWIRCILHAAVDPRQSAAHLGLEEYDKPAFTPNRTSIAANGRHDPVQKIVIYRCTSHGNRPFLTRADTASEYIWLD